LFSNIRPWTVGFHLLQLDLVTHTTALSRCITHFGSSLTHTGSVGLWLKRGERKGKKGEETTFGHGKGEGQEGREERKWGGTGCCCVTEIGEKERKREKKRIC
jgi:hypothetical protein